MGASSEDHESTEVSRHPSRPPDTQRPQDVSTVLRTQLTHQLKLPRRVCLGSDRLGSPSPSGVAHGFGLIPVDNVGAAVSGVSEVAGEEKIGCNGVQGTFHKDMTDDGMIFEAHKQIVKPLSQMCDHIWRASVRSENKCACVRTVRCSL